MALTPEWEKRIAMYLKALPARFAREIGAAELSGFTTMERLTPSEAAKREFRPMPEGTRWGKMWEYGWFRTTVTIPRDGNGRRVLLRCRPGIEGFALVNGEYVCSLSGSVLSGQREMIPLSAKARTGQRFDVLIEAYAGHGPTPCSPGLVPEGEEPWKDPDGPQITIGRYPLVVWEEEVYQFYLDMRTLSDVRHALPANALRVAQIDAALRAATTEVDAEAPWEELREAARAGRRRLQPLLECRNATAPTFHCFGHAHLDVAWLWPLQETERKMVRTISNTITLAKQYPEYRYLQSQPHLYWMLKERYPELYAQVKALVAAGRIIADGGMWVEADTNIAGGEALIRQFLHGKRFFQEEFGVESRVLWLPDVFGYSGALPQILRGCGVKYFSTQKIYWIYNGGDPFPWTEFIWEGIDGSEVIAHLHHNYNSHTNPEQIVRRWNDRPQKEGFDTHLFPFGWGDGGGGPDRDHLEYLRRCRDLEGVPRTKFSSPAEFFAELEQRGCADARYVGELYFQAHRGVLTTQARTKMLNRRAEFALREAEFWGAAAAALKGLAYPREEMTAAWRGALLNQFHDILPGSSIGRVYQEANRAAEEVIQTARKVAARSADSLTKPKDGAVTVFNSLAWPRRALVALPKDCTGRGQAINGVTHVEVEVPACGWASVPMKSEKGRVVQRGNALARIARGRPALENEHLRAEFNDRGEMVRLFDKDAQRELAAGPCNRFAMFKDQPVSFDAWDIDTSYTMMPVALPEPVKMEVAAAGPLVGILRMRRKLHRSELTQEILLRRGSRRIDFRTRVDWREWRKLLKVCFPVEAHADHALHEVQFGHVARPNHASRPFDADRFEVAQQKWTALVESGRGVAVLNDCKYGVSVSGKSINLTLLRAPIAPDKTADRGAHEFTYSLYAWNGPFAECGLVREAYDLNAPVWFAPGEAGARSLLTINAPNIILETLKPAEDGSGDWVLRFYEAMRTATRCAVHFDLPIRSAAQTDMLEGGARALPVGGRALTLDFRPFEIKTVRVRFGA